MSEEVRTVECQYVGKTYKVADTVFISRQGIYASKLNDFTLLSDFDCTSMLDTIPKSLKAEMSKRWRYVMHVSHGMTLSVTRNLLYARVIGGEILGYKFSQCSIDGNECAYYGFIPTYEKYMKTNDWHSKCRITMMSVFPRRLYVYLEKAGRCSCDAPNCFALQALNLSGSQKSRFCARDIPWAKLYVMMGELDDTCTEQVKEARECAICAQCFNCSKSVQFCRSHRVCKHKGSRTVRIGKDGEKRARDEPSIKIPKIRNCKVVKK